MSNAYTARQLTNARAKAIFRLKSFGVLLKSASNTDTQTIIACIETQRFKRLYGEDDVSYMNRFGSIKGPIDAELVPRCEAFPFKEMKPPRQPHLRQAEIDSLPRLISMSSNTPPTFNLEWREYR